MALENQVHIGTYVIDFLDTLKACPFRFRAHPSLTE